MKQPDGLSGGSTEVEDEDEIVQCFECPFCWLSRRVDHCPPCEEKRHFDLFNRRRIAELCIV